MEMTARLGILVGGGPAPGINSAISAAVIEAVNSGLSVVGILDGYKHLVNGRTDMVRPLDIPDVSRIHAQGGSILRISRTNPEDLPHQSRRQRGSPAAHRRQCQNAGYRLSGDHRR